MEQSKWGVHSSHCCFHHGCKYGAPDCPVVLGEVTQEHPCETCAEDEDERIEFAKRITATPEAFARHLSEISGATSDPKIIGAIVVALTRLRGY